jgi:hypothetical protein
MIALYLDKERQLIKITVSGNVSKDEISENLLAFIKLSSELEDGFSIINDLSGLDAGPEELLTLTKIHLKMAELGKIGKVVRVIGKSKSLLMKLSGFDQKFNITGLHYVPTVEAAVEFIGKS